MKRKRSIALDNTKARVAGEDEAWRKRESAKEPETSGGRPARDEGETAASVAAGSDRVI